MPLYCKEAAPVPDKHLNRGSGVIQGEIREPHTSDETEPNISSEQHVPQTWRNDLKTCSNWNKIAGNFKTVL